MSFRWGFDEGWADRVVAGHPSSLAVSCSAGGADSVGGETYRLTHRSRLRVTLFPENGLCHGRGFSDPHEGVVEYHVVPHAPYHSYVEAEGLRIDLDAAGFPIFVELARGWAKSRVDPMLVPPRSLALNGHRFLDFPVRFDPVAIRVSRDNSLFYIGLSDCPSATRWVFSEGAIWEADLHARLTGLWLLDVESDPSGCRRSTWRAEAWRVARRDAGYRWPRAATGTLSPISAGCAAE
jgi:hypothetical protein